MLVYLLIMMFLYLVVFGGPINVRETERLYYGRYPFTIYILIAFIANFPSFPLRLHKWIFFPTQLLLLPIFMVMYNYPLENPTEFFAMLFGVLAYCMLWSSSLYDRLKHCR